MSCRMLNLCIGRYRLCIADDPTHSVGSADNVHSYDHEYHLDEARAEYAITSRHSVRVAEENNEIASCILLAGGGASSVHEQSAIIHDESCILAVGPFLASLTIPTLALQWGTQTDFATCFGVYDCTEHRCMISHGELEIARVSYEGQLIWQSGGADIFTNGFTIHRDGVQVVDFNNTAYTFDIKTGRERRNGPN